MLCLHRNGAKFEVVIDVDKTMLSVVIYDKHQSQCLIIETS